MIPGHKGVLLPGKSGVVKSEKLEDIKTEHMWVVYPRHAMLGYKQNKQEYLSPKKNRVVYNKLLGIHVVAPKFNKSRLFYEKTFLLVFEYGLNKL